MTKKKYDLFGNIMEHGAIQMGTVGVVGLTGTMASRMPSTTSSNVMGSMGMMRTLPMVHGVGVTFGSLSMLGDVERRAKKRR